MKVYALVGKSGTGKSYKALHVAGLYDIEYMIDDGILIKGTKIIAGSSAKREETRFAAVKRAVFLDEEHRNQVVEALSIYDPDKLLIVGTSEHMIQTIMSTLGIGLEYELIRIEDISTKSEIEAAAVARRQKGKHVIPVPTFEVKKEFSGYFLDSLRQKIKKDEKQELSYEKTVMRPTFSYLGKFDITPGALKTISSHSASEVFEVYRIQSVEVENRKNGVVITLSVVLYLRKPLLEVSGEISTAVKRSVEYMTGMNVIQVNIIVKNIRV